MHEFIVKYLSKLYKNFKLISFQPRKLEKVKNNNTNENYFIIRFVRFDTYIKKENCHTLFMIVISTLSTIIDFQFFTVIFKLFIMTKSFSLFHSDCVISTFFFYFI